VLRIRDVYSGSRILDLGSRIPDPKTAAKERGEQICCHTFFCSHKFHKIENYFIFEMLKKNFLASFQRIFNFLPQNLLLSSQKYRVGIRDMDPRSGIRKKPIPDSGSGSSGQKGTGSRIRIRNTGLFLLD
jgi:hypothetical protein